MPVSYMLDIEQLSVLARYSGVEDLPGLPDFPAMDTKKNDEILKKLVEMGMVHLHSKEASVDLGLAFVLQAMAHPELLVQTLTVSCWCTKNLAVVISPDVHAKNRYRITPLPNVPELMRRMWESVETGREYRDFSIWKAGVGWEQSHMSKTEFEKLIAAVYREASEK